MNAPSVTEIRRAAVAFVRSEVDRLNPPDQHRSKGQTELHKLFAAKLGDDRAPTPQTISQWYRVKKMSFESARLVCEYADLSEAELVTKYGGGSRATDADPKVVPIPAPRKKSRVSSRPPQSTSAVIPKRPGIDR